MNWKKQTGALCATVSALAALAIFTTPCPAEEAKPAGRDGVFIHLSAGADNPHRVLMALKMAEVMLEGGRDVLVYCDIKAVGLLVNDAPDLTHNGFDHSAPMLAKLIENGVPVRACPSCLKAAGKSPDDLIPGVKLADRDEFFSFTDGRILTIDY